MKDKERLRSRVVVTRVTEREFHEMLAAAAQLDLTFSEFLRQAGLIMARGKFNKN